MINGPMLPLFLSFQNYSIAHSVKTVLSRIFYRDYPPVFGIIFFKFIADERIFYYLDTTHPLDNFLPLLFTTSYQVNL